MLQLRVLTSLLLVALISFPLFSQHIHDYESMRQIQLRGIDQRTVIFQPDFQAARSVVSVEEMEKLDPFFIEVLSQARRGLMKQIPELQSDKLPAGIYKSPNGTLLFDAIIHSSDFDRVRTAGIHLNTEMPSFATARITVDQLDRLVSIPEVAYIDPGSISYPAMDMSYFDTGVQYIHNGWIHDTPYTGEGAILLVIDSGVDWSHPDFLDPDDSTKSRIRYLWDVTLSRRTGDQSPGGSLNYGVEYTREDIEAALAGNGTVRSFDTYSHGTHVLGTAAGSGIRYPGIAPGAEIIVVRGGVDSFTTNNVINGLHYAKQKSDELGLPVVVNLSLGSTRGPRDGSLPYEVTIDSYSQDPGYVVVTSAGNTGGLPLHTAGSVSPADTARIFFTVPEYEPGQSDNQIRLEVWFQGNGGVSATAISPSGITYSRRSNQQGSAGDRNDGRIYVSNVSQSGNNHRRIILEISRASQNNPAAGIWTLEITGATEHMDYDAWLVEYIVGEPPDFVILHDGDNELSVASPASAQYAVTVGSYNTKTSWVTDDTLFVGYRYADETPVPTQIISGFSSRGPTRDGRLKPEITAPGQGIGAALSGEIFSPFNLILLPGQEHIIYQGTSMAAPHVTGVVALLLSVDPHLTASDIQKIFSKTGRTDQYTGITPNNTWGYGKLDALGAMLHLLSYEDFAAFEILEYHNRLSEVFDITDSSPMAVRFTPSISGKVSELFVYTHILPQEDYNFEVGFYTSNDGIPGELITEVIQIRTSSLFERYYNYIDLTDVEIPVLTGNDYFVVFSTDDEQARIPLIFDTGHNQSNRTLMGTGNTWQPFVVNNSERELVVRIGVTELESSITYTEDIMMELPEKVTLYQNYPNPFNPSTKIRFSIPEQASVKLTVYDILGRRVAKILDEELDAGEYSHVFDASHLASGLYLYRLQALDLIKTKRLVLVK